MKWIIEEQKRLIQPVTHKWRKTKETGKVLNAIEPKKTKGAKKKIVHKFLHRGTPTKTQTGREQNSGSLLPGGLFPEKKLSAQGTMERRKGPLPSPPADFLCAFEARGNEYRSVVELETYDKELFWSKGDSNPGKPL